MVLLSEEPHPRWMRRHSRSILYSWMSPRSIVAPQKDRVGKLPNQLPSRYHGLPAVDIADITYSRDMLWGISPRHSRRRPLGEKRSELMSTFCRQAARRAP
jgi:hypothetical protein